MSSVISELGQVAAQGGGDASEPAGGKFFGNRRPLCFVATTTNVQSRFARGSAVPDQRVVLPHKTTAEKTSVRYPQNAENEGASKWAASSITPHALANISLRLSKKGTPISGAPML